MFCPTTVGQNQGVIRYDVWIDASWQRIGDQVPFCATGPELPGRSVPASDCLQSGGSAGRSVRNRLFGVRGVIVWFDHMLDHIEQDAPDVIVIDLVQHLAVLAVAAYQAGSAESAQVVADQ